MTIRKKTRRKKTYSDSRQAPKTENQGSDRFKKTYSYYQQPQNDNS